MERATQEWPCLHSQKLGEVRGISISQKLGDGNTTLSKKHINRTLKVKDLISLNFMSIYCNITLFITNYGDRCSLHPGVMKTALSLPSNNRHHLLKAKNLVLIFQENKNLQQQMPKSSATQTAAKCMSSKWWKLVTAPPCSACSKAMFFFLGVQ